MTGQATPRSWLAGLIGQGVGPSLTPELHEREAQRQGLRYVYKVVEQPAGPLDRRGSSGCWPVRSSSASTGSTSPIR